MRAAFLLVLALPVLADAPPKVLVRPVAICEHNKCVMSEKDYRLLQDFHSAKMMELQQANSLIEQAAEEITKLRQMLARYASHCWRKT